MWGSKREQRESCEKGVLAHACSVWPEKKLRALTYLARGLSQDLFASCVPSAHLLLLL